MKLPRLFREIHGDQIFNLWMKLDRPPYIRIVPQEPLGCVMAGPGEVTLGSVVTIVTVRCWNDRGTMQFEAAQPSDLKVAQDWAKKHNDTPPEAFRWYPQMEQAK